MRLINILMCVLVLACALWVVTARMATTKAVAQKDYCEEKCLAEIAIKDAEIEELTHKLLKAEAVEETKQNGKACCCCGSQPAEISV